MARRNDGLFDDLFEIAKDSPGAGIVMAAISAAVGAWLMWVQPKVSPYARVFGGVLLILAMTLAMVSGVWFIRHWAASGTRSRRLADCTSLRNLLALTPSQFEETIADLFRRDGFTVEETGGPADAGVDLRVTDPRTSAGVHLVQCKRYHKRLVRLRDVRDFYGAMAAHATRCQGIFITCGYFTDSAINFARTNGVRLIDAPALMDWINRSNPIKPAVSQCLDLPVHASVSASRTNRQFAPNCPSCGTRMVQRIAKHGAHSGTAFWGCSNYPQCREIVNQIVKTHA